MERITKTQIEDSKRILDTFVLRNNIPTSLFEAGILLGIELSKIPETSELMEASWGTDPDNKLFSLIFFTKPKPHVAEVVKCGDINKSKSNDHPQEWFDAQRKELERHYKEDFAEGMLSGNRKDIEDMVTLCDHVSDARTVDKTGLIKCLKCGKWVNIYDL